LTIFDKLAPIRHRTVRVPEAFEIYHAALVLHGTGLAEDDRHFPEPSSE
jgi:hypothetical protein